jgi:hypothetical protein
MWRLPNYSSVTCSRTLSVGTDSAASNCRMIDELERIWKEAIFLHRSAILEFPSKLKRKPLNSFTIVGVPAGTVNDYLYHKFRATVFKIIIEWGTASVVSWSQFLAAKPEVPCSIPSATRFSEWQWVWNGLHSALLRINEELLEREAAAPV